MPLTSKFGYPYLKRKDMIRELAKKSDQFETIEYHGRQQQLKVIEIRIEALIYRLENIRTITSQKEWLAKHPEKSRNFFTSDPGAIEVQEVQHSLLKQIVTHDNLISDFTIKKNKPVRYQKYNLIISDDGTVVNGNCRLCAWRELYYGNSELYKHFEMIRVTVLPDSDPEGMYDLEVNLQLDEPQKQEYVWHAIAADSKARIERNTDVELVAARRNMTVKEILNMVEAYDYADEYLKATGHPDEWSRVTKQDYAFKQIVAGRKKLSKPGEKELFNAISKAILSQPVKGERLYSYIPKAINNLPKIAEKLKEVFDINISDSKDDDLAILLGGDTNDADTANAQIAAEINRINNDSLVVNTVTEVINTADELDKEKEKSEFVFQQVRKAATDLNNAISNLSDSMNKDGVDRQLETIENCVVLLKNWLRD